MSVSVACQAIGVDVLLVRKQVACLVEAIQTFVNLLLHVVVANSIGVGGGRVASVLFAVSLVVKREQVV